ncbi:MAG: rhamnulokinase family protein [Bowdeniella nasicola]|nr:rhamnulokinase family protein [Bowdeniella nasicola]
MATHHAAVDLGASNGRVIVGEVADGTITLHEVHRFPNGAIPVGDRLYTDTLGLYAGVLEGLRRARHHFSVCSIGVDSWGVDYGRIDREGQLLGSPRHYRDERTLPHIETLRERMNDQDVYTATGINIAPYNSIYQLMDDATSIQWDLVERVLFTPDLIGYLLSGRAGAEVTIASSSQLLNAATREWSPKVAKAAGIPLSIFAPLEEPGTRRGPIRADLIDGDPIELIAVGGHDTASAVAATPASDAHFAYISCGTWSVVGAELEAPITSAAAREAGYTNELGVQGRVRFNRNLTGLWLLQECQREWRERGENADLMDLLDAAAAAPSLRSVVDAGSEVFLPRGGMEERIKEECRRTDQPVPETPGEVVRCVLDSLALSHAQTIRSIEELGGPEVRVVHIVGGGSLNELLCQLTADACQLPVVAGPVEAAALGNVLMQAHAMGEIEGELTDLRAVVAASGGVRRYEPHGNAEVWRSASARLGL